MTRDGTLPLTIWMNMPSFYQADLFRALVSSGKTDLQVIFARPLPASRTDLGWEADTDGYQSFNLRRGFAGLIDVAKLAFRQRHRIHVVNAVWAEALFVFALLLFSVLRTDYFIYSEASDPTIQRSSLKVLFRNTFGKLLLWRTRGVLAVAELGRNFYEPLVRNRQSIYSFGYFRSAPQVVNARRPRDDNTKQLHLLFIGQLVERKGVDLLLRAVASSKALRDAFVLHIIGAGEAHTALLRLACDLDIANKVYFEGVVPARQIPLRISEADLLVLPSRWDGWGLVINEALAAGTPVIVSDTCGAADLIQNGVNGYQFQTESIADLRDKLILFLENRARGGSLRAGALATARSITPERAAFYLLDCIQHATGRRATRPIPPWSASDNSSIRPLSTHLATQV